MHDELTAVDIKKMEQEVEYRRLQLRPQLQAAVFDLLLHLFDIDGCQFVMHRYAPPVQRYSTRFFRKSKTNFDFSALCGMIQKRN